MTKRSMTALLGATTLALLPVAAFAQDPGSIQRMFEAGHYQQVIDAAQPGSNPSVIFTAAQSEQRLGANDQAIELYLQLSARPPGDAWHFVGLSGQQLVGGDDNGALASARQAVSMAGGLPEAHYQLGLVLAKRQEWANAAAEFDRTAELNPSYAYAHYYGGLMHYRNNRPDRMANHFDQFMKLAPEAPERPEVTQILRTVRGR
jgi:tetratricopeptide (TPR) repeat protein